MLWRQRAEDQHQVGEYVAGVGYMSDIQFAAMRKSLNSHNMKKQLPKMSEEQRKQRTAQANVARRRSTQSDSGTT